MKRIMNVTADGTDAPCATKPKAYQTDRIVNCNGNITYSQTADGTITITITGTPAENLHRAANAMNSVSWLDKDNTAASIIAHFAVGDFLSRWGEQAPHYTPFSDFFDEVSGIAESIDTMADDDETDEKRKKELLAAFYLEFNFVPNPKWESAKDDK